MAVLFSITRGSPFADVKELERLRTHLGYSQVSDFVFTDESQRLAEALNRLPVNVDLIFINPLEAGKETELAPFVNPYYGNRKVLIFRNKIAPSSSLQTPLIKIPSPSVIPPTSLPRTPSQPITTPPLSLLTPSRPPPPIATPSLSSLTPSQPIAPPSFPPSIPSQSLPSITAPLTSFQPPPPITPLRGGLPPSIPSQPLPPITAPQIPSSPRGEVLPPITSPSLLSPPITAPQIQEEVPPRDAPSSPWDLAVNTAVAFFGDLLEEPITEEDLQSIDPDSPEEALQRAQQFAALFKELRYFSDKYNQLGEATTPKQKIEYNHLENLITNRKVNFYEMNPPSFLLPIIIRFDVDYSDILFLTNRLADGKLNLNQAADLLVSLGYHLKESKGDGKSGEAEGEEDEEDEEDWSPSEKDMDSFIESVIENYYEAEGESAASHYDLLLDLIQTALKKAPPAYLDNLRTLLAERERRGKEALKLIPTVVRKWKAKA